MLRKWKQLDSPAKGKYLLLLLMALFFLESFLSIPFFARTVLYGILCYFLYRGHGRARVLIKILLILALFLNLFALIGNYFQVGRFFDGNATPWVIFYSVYFLFGLWVLFFSKLFKSYIHARMYQRKVALEEKTQDSGQGLPRWKKWIIFLSILALLAGAVFVDYRILVRRERPAPCRDHFLGAQGIGALINGPEMSPWFGDAPHSDGEIDAALVPFFNPDSTLDFEAVTGLFIRTEPGFSTLEWQTLLGLFGDQRVSYEDILLIYEDLQSAPHICNDAHCVTQKLARDFGALYMKEVEAGRWHGNVDWEALRAMLRRAQLLTFFDEMLHTGSRFEARDFDLSDVSERWNAVVRYRGVSYPMPPLAWERFYFTDRLQAAILGTTSLSGTRTWLSREYRVRSAEIWHFHSMAGSATARLHGGVASMYTPNGYRLIGISFSSNDAMVRLAGLAELGFSPELVMELLIHEGEGAGTVHRYLHSVGPDSDRAKFWSRLHGIYYENFDMIMEKFGDRYPDLRYDGWLGSLPLEVLEEVIRLSR